ncbi:MAG: UbiD family decarboxylase, partial [Candidatus Tectomicrobia bacterium]|nr:UbiD family decarboxylase [Candidatus Tectomicrobia bacterium]
MDFRRFLKRLEEVGELKTIPDETHWSLEAAALCAMTNRVGGPAIFFPKVKGYPSGHGLAGSLLTGPGTMFYQERTPWGRIAVALGLDKGISYEALMEVLIERRLHPIPPLRVSTGPCKEVIARDREADLFSLPFPYLYEGDGGRYGTCQVLIVKDPEMDWVNWGVYRFMLLTQDRLAIHMGPRSHIGAIYRKYERRGEPMPCCIALGVEPAALLAAATTLPVGLSEAEVAGGFKQDPIELVKAEANDLLVPARAEAILEGYIPPGERAMEGPFVDLIRRTEPQPRPVFHLTALTRRQAPILPFVAEGAKVSDSLAIRSLLASLNLTLKCRTERQFQVRWINLPVEARLGL